MEKIEHTHPEKPADKKPKHKENRQNKTTIRTENRDEIIIPLPTYGYGATRRSKFAFGRITAAQARTNTQIENATTTTDTTIQDNDHEEPNIEYPELEEETETIVQEMEEFEEDPFQFDEDPSKENCA